MNFVASAKHTKQTNPPPSPGITLINLMTNEAPNELRFAGIWHNSMRLFFSQCAIICNMWKVLKYIFPRAIMPKAIAAMMPSQTPLSCNEDASTLHSFYLHSFPPLLPQSPSLGSGNWCESANQSNITTPDPQVVCGLFPHADAHSWATCRTNVCLMVPALKLYV